MRLSGATRSSKHQTARTLLIQALSGGAQVATNAATPTVDPADIEKAFHLVIAHLRDLRVGVGRGVNAILRHVAPEMDKEKMHRWIVDKIVTPSTRLDADEEGPC